MRCLLRSSAPTAWSALAMSLALPLLAFCISIAMPAAPALAAVVGQRILTISVTDIGGATGTVIGTDSASPSVLSCGVTCTTVSGTYTGNPTITLTATPTRGSIFVGWGGACSGTGTCVVTVSTNLGVTATFASAFSLSVTISGGSSGTVTSSPTGVGCSSTCTASFAAGTNVTLTATAASSSFFAGWSGACSGTGTCVVTMGGNQSVSATFAAKVTYTLTASTAGAGTVTGAGSYTAPTVATLTATPASGSMFTGWSGACSGTSPICQVTMTSNQSATAMFAPVLAALRAGAVYSSAQASSQSFLRFYNASANAGNVAVTLMDASTGVQLGQWVSPSIQGFSEQQFPIATIESGTGATFAKPNYYSIVVQSTFAGYFQHVLWRSSDGTLTNLSTCDTGVTADPSKLGGVHSSLLSGGYPSTLIVNNTGASAATATLQIYDARNGGGFGSYTTASIPSGGQAFVSVATIEAALTTRTLRSDGTTVTSPFQPSAGMYHYVVQTESGFTGFLQNLVTNTQAGVVTDMTIACPLGAQSSSADFSTLGAGAVYSTAQTASQSFLRFYNTDASAGTVTVNLRDYASGYLLAQWTSPSIPAGAEQQFPIATVENAATASFIKPSYYSIDVQSGFTGYFQHVLWRASDGTLTNLSTCNTGVGADPTKLSGVHSSLLAAGYPSRIVVNNTGAAAETVALDISDAASGAKLGTYSTASIPANGQVIVSASTIEAAIGLSPAAGMYHYVVQAESPFSGFLQNLVDNLQDGVTTDMTTACAMTSANATPSSSTMIFTASFSDGEVGTITFVVQGALPTSAAPVANTQSAIERAQASLPVQGAIITISPAEGSVKAAGSYDPSSGAVNLAGGGYTVVGTVNGTGITGTITNTKSGTQSHLSGTMQIPLDIRVAGNGRVSAAPKGVIQGGNRLYPIGTNVTLTETHNAASTTFLNWGGDACNGSAANTCTITMTAARKEVATFSPKAVDTLTVAVSNTGTGNVRVTANQRAVGAASINYPCNAACGTSPGVPVAPGTLVDFVAIITSPDTTFLGWHVTGGSTGPCETTASSCTMQINQDTTVEAHFLGQTNSGGGGAGGGGGGGGGGGTGALTGQFSGTWTTTGPGRLNGQNCTWTAHSPLSMTLAQNGSALVAANVSFTALNYNGDCSSAGSTTYNGGNGNGTVSLGAVNMNLVIPGAGVFNIVGEQIGNTISGTMSAGGFIGPVTLSLQ